MKIPVNVVIGVLVVGAVGYTVARVLIAAYSVVMQIVAVLPQ
jgi:hypothetical protein